MMCTIQCEFLLALRYFNLYAKNLRVLSWAFKYCLILLYNCLADDKRRADRLGEQ